MAKFRLEIQGAKKLERKLRQLEPKVRRKILSRALRAGAKVIQAAAIEGAPVDTGLLKKSIKVRVAKGIRRGTVGINVITGAGDFKGETYYGAFQEYGTATLPAKKYMRKAFDQKREQAGKVARDLIWSGIKQEASGS